MLSANFGYTLNSNPKAHVRFSSPKAVRTWDLR